MTLVSVVIPHVNGEELLRSCLVALAQQTVTTEVIIVDNGSSDSSIDVALELCPGARLIRNNANRGYSEACAQGA